MTEQIKGRKCVANLTSNKPGDPRIELKHSLGIDHVIKLCSNENPLGPSKQAVAAMQEAVKKVNYYPDGNSVYLRRVLSLELGVTINQLLFGNGSDEIIKLISEAYVNSGDKVHVFHPSFSEYHFAAELMGGSLVRVDTDDMKCDLSKMLASVTEDTKLIYLANPNNPTGTIYTKSELKDFMDRLPQNIVVVSDEAYHEYVQDENYGTGMDLINSYPNLIILRTFSKLYGLAGIRIGYAVANDHLIDQLQRVREPFNVNSIAQVGAIASIDDTEHIEKSKEITRRGLAYYYKQLPKIGLGYVKSEANYLLVDLNGKCDQEITEELSKKGIVVKSGTSLGIPGYLRVSVGLVHENHTLIKVLKELLYDNYKKYRKVRTG